ncbi:phosphatidate cytidylyltransferase [Celeribacter sp.]|uniref:phosphatidate cytidylyltransferase n=1 Tax=Celeribacter sp. TaxID=1890673 RepID=UPI003A957AE2
MSAAWSDLRVRVLSAIAMIGVGLGALYAGPDPFLLLIGIVLAVGVFELISMGRKKSATGVFSFADFFGLSLYAFMICLGALGLVALRFRYGEGGVLAVVALVVVTDTMGYFVGRLVGGPKFWPSISPKKTWSGILGGWLGAAILGAIVFTTEAFTGPLVLAVLGAASLSFLSQMGDIIESALKRRMGVKDSSNLIPGHGGVLDRFDALLAVSAVLMPFVLFG